MNTNKQHKQSSALRHLARRIRRRIDRCVSGGRLALVRHRAKTIGPQAVVRIPGTPFRIQVNDGSNFYVQYKDEFIQRIYHFESTTRSPRIIDGGGNTGMSICYFKHMYPDAQIISFEPDPTIFRVLKKNIKRNGLTNVELINAGLAAHDGEACFTPDGAAGGQIVDDSSSDTTRIKVTRLSNYLDEPADFVKLNIEGLEQHVLEELADAGKLHNVRQMVIEYHGFPQSQQRLGAILSLLDRHGFRYLLHDFDSHTCGASKPPFKLRAASPWFCLIYACHVRSAGELKVAA